MEKEYKPCAAASAEFGVSAQPHHRQKIRLGG
jgi:hypothetical protein